MTATIHFKLCLHGVIKRIALAEGDRWVVHGNGQMAFTRGTNPFWFYDVQGQKRSKTLPLGLKHIPLDQAREFSRLISLVGGWPVHHADGSHSNTFRVGPAARYMFQPKLMLLDMAEGRLESGDRLLINPRTWDIGFLRPAIGVFAIREGDEQRLESLHLRTAGAGQMSEETMRAIVTLVSAVCGFVCVQEEPGARGTIPFLLA